MTRQPASGDKFLDAERLAPYLSDKLGKRVRIESITQAFPGLSRETWLIRFQRDAKPPLPGVVVRADAPGGPFVPVPLFREWQVFEHVARTPIPVAKPPWFDDRPKITQGRPLFVRELVEGTTLLPGLSDDTPAAADRRRRVALEHAEKLAALHRIDWKAYGFGEFMQVPMSAEAA